MAGVERVIVDGSNLAFALARDAGRGGGPRPQVAVIAAVRAAFPAGVRVEVIFDGAADSVGIGRSGTMARAASNLYVEHAGRLSADRVIEGTVAAQLSLDGPAGTWAILVVTDDRELRGLVQARGARVAGTAWLAGRVARIGTAGGRSGTAIGHPRPPRGPRC